MKLKRKGERYSIRSQGKLGREMQALSRACQFNMQMANAWNQDAMANAHVANSLQAGQRNWMSLLPHDDPPFVPRKRSWFQRWFTP